MTICLAGIATDYTIANDTILNTQLLCDDTIPKTQLITQFLVNDTILTTPLLGNDTILTTPLLCNDTIPTTHAILVHKVLFIPIGMVERCHRTIDVIRKVMTDQTDWLPTLNSVLFSIQCQVHSSTGFSPF